MGGHSLLATRAISRIRAALGINDRLSVRALFDAPTPAALARVVEALNDHVNEENGYIAIPHLDIPDGELSALSFAQERLYFLEMLHPGQTAYIIPLAFWLSGDLNLHALGSALSGLRQRHEMLRATFCEVNGVIMQRINAWAPEELPVVNISTTSKEHRDRVVQEHLDEENSRIFDLHNEPLYRYKLFKLAQDEHVLSICIHHLATDAWSDEIVQRELDASYTAYCTNEIPSLPQLPITYMDYSAWQRTSVQTIRQDAQLAYWVDTLKGSTPVEFPSDFPRPPTLSARAGIEPLNILGNSAIALERLVSSLDATPFIVLLSILRLLHFRLTGIEDASIGNPIANRNHVDAEPIVGFFVNTQAMRIPLENGMTFRELCQRVRGVATAAYDAQDVAFERIVHEIQPVRDLSRNPIVQVMIAVHPDATTFGAGGMPNGLKVEPLRVEPVTRFDLELHFVKTSDGRGFKGHLSYSRDLYSKESARKLAHQFWSLLEQAISEVEDISLEDFVLPGAIESLGQFGLLEDDAVPFPRDKGLGELFKAAAAKHAERVAVRDDTAAGIKFSSLTYGELDALSDTIAYNLMSLGLSPQTLVGLFVPRSAVYIAGILGIIKAGLAYLPLDPQLPAERLSLLIADIPHNSVVLCADGVEVPIGLDVGALGVNMVQIEDLFTSNNEQGSFDVSSHVDGHSLAYAMCVDLFLFIIRTILDCLIYVSLKGIHLVQQANQSLY